AGQPRWPAIPRSSRCTWAPMPMLSLTRVCASYSSFQALFDVSVEVEAGEAVAVIGPNGAGKTTLLRVISKLIEATSGEIRMEGASLARVPAHEVVSGGEQQMCAIGRALMSGPKLLLLDEPSAGLAPVVVQSIFDLVRRICAQGYTVLIVEQNIRQVLKVVGRAYLLEAGRIKLAGNSKEFLDSEEIRKTYLGL